MKGVEKIVTAMAMMRSESRSRVFVRVPKNVNLSNLKYMDRQMDGQTSLDQLSK